MQYSGICSLLSNRTRERISESVSHVMFISTHLLCLLGRHSFVCGVNQKYISISISCAVTNHVMHLMPHDDSGRDGKLDQGMEKKGREGDESKNEH